MSEDPYQIRELDDADIAGIESLENRVFGADAWSFALLEEELASRWSSYLGVFRGTELIAYGGIKGDREGDLMTIGVVPAFRGTGVGRTLLRALVDRARQRGMRELFLEVRTSNRAARNLYVSEGFEELATVPSYYRNPTEDAVTMRLRIG